MIKRKGDVFTTETMWIGHGVNCRGVMGAGIAKTIRQKFPVTYESYAKRCLSGELKPGDIFSVYENKRIIVNLATQNLPGPDARYDAIFESCRKAAERIMDPESCWADQSPKVLAIPMIGCGIGGLDWNRVETLLEAVEILVPGFQFEVWKYE